MNKNCNWIKKSICHQIVIACCCFIAKVFEIDAESKNLSFKQNIWYCIFLPRWTNFLGFIPLWIAIELKIRAVLTISKTIQNWPFYNHFRNKWYFWGIMIQWLETYDMFTKERLYEIWCWTYIKKITIIDQEITGKKGFRNY